MEKTPFRSIATLGTALFLLWEGLLCAQGSNLGIPPIRNFTKKTYHAGTQNWDAAQDRRGVLFFANNEGLLQFDGSRWACYPVANKTVVRSVAIDETGRIFVGAQNELGCFFPEANGQLRYHSLTNLLPNRPNFEDIWDIVVVHGTVFFRSKKYIFQYTNGAFQTHEPGGNLTAMCATSQGLFVQRNLSELLFFENGRFRPFLQSPELASELTGAMRWQGDTLLFSSLKNGLFCLVGGQLSRWATPHDAFLREKRIYSATALPNGHLALATSLDGVVELSAQRRIFRHLTKKTGLQNNNILHAFADRAGNLWLGLDNGIDCAALPSPFTYIVPDGDLQGTGYAAALSDGQLWLGVSNGVYHTAWQKQFNPERQPLFEKITAVEGQVWSLRSLEGTLLLGHHEGSFQQTGPAFDRMSNEPGAWTFVPLDGDFLLGGNYSGLVLYRKSGNRWVFDQKIPGFNESCRFMVKDADGAIWVAHPYRGLFRITWPSARPGGAPQVAFFNAQNGLPSDLNNCVFSIAGKAVFVAEKGVFRFDKTHSRFIRDEDFDRVLGENTRVKYLREDAAGNIWYVSDQEVGVLEVDDFGLKKKVNKRTFPELSDKLVAGFEFIFPLDAQNVLFGSERGFVHFNAAATGLRDTALQLVFSRIKASGARDSTLFGGYFLKNGQLSAEQHPEARPILSANMNSLLFAFSAADFCDPALVEYRSKLEGLEDDWTAWSSENARHFINLNPGTYQFAAQARLKGKSEMATLHFSFRVRPPWYASTAAFVLYALGVLGLFAGFLVRQHRKFEREKVNMAEKHQQITVQQQLEVEQSKAALTDILREKLETEIQYKNKELATATMHLVQKGEILQVIQENLNLILEKSTNPEVKKEVRQLLNLLNFDAKLDEDWEQFAVHFDQVHVDFLKRLRERYPQLGPIDHKLCAYLRMNLTTKEIAPLMNISIRGVEASRYRLRKKLGLSNDANLTEVIAGM